MITKLEQRFGKFTEKKKEKILIDIERYKLILGFQRSIGMRNESMIRDALTKKDIAKSTTLINHNFEADTEMMEFISRANSLLLLFEQVERMKSVVMSLKQTTISEVRSYSKPPAAIFNVMQATYLLLGEKKENLLVRIKKWQR